MKPRKLHQVIPAVAMAGAAAVPVATAVEILSHVPGGRSAAPLQPSAPVAVAPARSSSSSTAAPAPSGAPQTYQGPVVSDPFGGVQAMVTVTGKKITDVAISAPQDNPRSASINQQAVPLLRSETLQAQSAQINTVSGATYTSQAYTQSLQAALDKARSQGNAPAVNPPVSPSGGALAGAAQASAVRAPGDD
jgi:uncharacterized protein with FMN-binding domain